MRTRPVTPPAGWREFYDRYLATEAHWYISKGESVSPASLRLIQAQLRVLRSYEKRVWRLCQGAYARGLKAKGLYEPRRGQEPDARARVLKVCFETLGLAWTDSKRKVALTPAGRAFVRASFAQAREIAADQIERWQLVNPALPTPAFADLRVFPYFALLAVLLKLPDNRLTVEEFTLFVMRLTNEDEPEIEKTISEILRYRQAPEPERTALVQALRRTYLPGSKAWQPTSLLERIERVAGYLLNFLSNGRHVRLEEGKTVMLRPDFVNRARERLRQHQREECWIEFADRKDWIAYYGNPEFRPTLSFALDVYRDRSAPVQAQKVLATAHHRGVSLPVGKDEDWLTSVQRERVIEEYLEHGLQHLEKGLKLAIVEGRRGRQFPTRVGPVDLLGVDGSGWYVVIELKKGRPSDKVVGQLLRYVSALREEYGWEKIRGFIVTEEVDPRLRASFRELIREREGWKLFNADFNIRFALVEPVGA